MELGAIDISLMELIIGGILLAVLAGVMAYLMNRNVKDAIGVTIDNLMANQPWILSVEQEIDEQVPAEVQEVIKALLALADRLAEGTADEVDDKLVDLLKAVIGKTE